MQFLPFLAVLMTALLSTASPIHSRDLSGVLVCTDVNATGSCTHMNATLDTCIDLVAPYYKNASTFGPETDGFYCYPYLVACDGECRSPEGCTYGAITYNSTAKANFTSGGWNHLIESFECHAGAAPEP